MRLPRTISKYLLREALVYTTLGLVAITIVLVSRNLLRFLDELVAAGLTGGDLLAVMRCLFSMLAAYTLPLALLFGVLLSIGRMAADSEIVAMRACGLGLREIAMPMVALGVLGSLITGYLLIEVEHRARRELRLVLKSVAARGAAIEPGRFLRIGDRVLFVRDRDAQGELSGVVISDRTDPERPFMVFAETGRVDLDEERADLTFRLQRGDIHIEPNEASGGRYQHIAFEGLDYSFDAARLLGRDFSRLDPRQMSMGELRDVLDRARRGEKLENVREKDPTEYALQIHRRIALPLAPLLFVLVAVPLGLRRSRGVRSWSAMLCGLLAATYYMILTFCQFLSLQGYLPAAVAIWAPNAAFAAAAALLLHRASRPER